MPLEDFSSGYYSVDMQVQPYADGPVIDSAIHDYISDEVYAQTDAPITMKLSLNNGAYFNVESENGVPPSVLALPQAWVDNFREAAVGERQTVFVLKPSHSYLMHLRDIDRESIRNTALDDFTDE